jgi:hypothetical protein
MPSDVDTPSTRELVLLEAIAQNKQKIDNALSIAAECGQYDGYHHKTWVIDQMVRALTGDNYNLWVQDHKDGEDGPETYDWDTGIAP